MPWSKARASVDLIGCEPLAFNQCKGFLAFGTGDGLMGHGRGHIDVDRVGCGTLASNQYKGLLEVGLGKGLKGLGRLSRHDRHYKKEFVLLMI